MRRCLSLTMLAVSLTVSACWAGDPAPKETQRPGTLPPVGEPVDFTFYTHCGIESAQIGGVRWQAVKPLYGADGERGNPPEGWDNPTQDGRLTMLSSEQAVFEARG
jgi:hypothetical protein